MRLRVPAMMDEAPAQIHQTTKQRTKICKHVFLLYISGY